MKILEFHLRIMKIMKMLEFHARITKIMKKKKNTYENQENHENIRMPLENM